jgi:hypothetical protein
VVYVFSPYLILNFQLKRSTCNNHNAVNRTNTGHNHLEATGIAAIACARHGCFYPHAVVDFQKGEQYVLSFIWHRPGFHYIIDRETSIMHFARQPKKWLQSRAF